MDNLKKLGLTALASTLAAVSAQAGEMSVTGSFNATYSTQSGNTGSAIPATYGANGDDPDHGVGFGNDKDVGFSGSGELDNGWTFSGNTLMKDSFDVSSSNLSLTMGSMGTISIGSQTGGASTKYDVQTPNAYEEVDDGGAVSISSNFVGNYLDNNALVYNSPSMDMMGMTVSADLEYTPKASGTSPNDGGVQTSATYGNAWGVGLTATGAGLTIGVYGSERENIDQVAATARDPRDAFTGVWYANYTMGPVSIGYSESYYDSGLVVSVEAVTAAKSPGVAGGIFESNTMSIAFNVNDNLSLSYAKGEDTYDAQQDNRDGTTAIADVEMDLKSIQAAYSMGAMSIKAYRTETDNAAYSTIGGSLTVTEVALGLAF